MSDISAAQVSESTPNRVFSTRLSGPGVAAAVFFFGASLVPSLLPRTGLFQGLVSGVTLMIGYGLGVLAQWLWNYLEIPTPGPGTTMRRVLFWGTVAVVGFVAVATTWRQVGWQNDVRELFGMDSIGPSVWVPIIPITLIVATVVLILARSLRRLFQLFAHRLTKIMPRRVARLLGGVALAVLLLFLVNGVLIDTFFGVANSAFSVRDTATAEGVTQPQSSERSGSPESLIAWDTLGRQGRSFVASGPSVDDLNEFHGGGAEQPIRIYAGLKSADTLQQRADLVLQDLIRAGGFDRELLVVATTTGTGFLVPEGMDTLEYLHNGSTAIVGVQYSYLPSWISLLADQEVTKETSQVVFRTVHDYWSSLPEDSRPEIYLFGLSLGSFGVESILSSISIINEPIDGALMVGPPFVNDLWNEITDARDEGSPAWLPIFEEGRTVRFTSLENALDVPRGEWENTKLVYLQHNSDPVSFFSPSLALRSPEWLEEGQRGPDLPAAMSWTPFVTMWQVMMDLPAAGNVPPGYGHLYQSGEYLDGWLGVTEPAGWADGDTEALRELLERLDAKREAAG